MEFWPKVQRILKVNDQVEIRFGNKLLLVKVLEMKDSTKKEDAAGMYEIISETRVEENVQKYCTNE